MFARVTEFKIDARRRQDATQISHEQFGPSFRELPGFQRYFVFADTQTGGTMVVTLWDSEETEVASRGTVATRFAALGYIVTEPPRPSRVFQVVDQA